MATRTPVAKVSAFAHLLGMATGKKADMPEDQPPADETEEEKAARLAAEGEDQPPADETEEEKAARLAAESDDDETCEDDEDDADMAKAKASARKAENIRCARIFASPAAGTRPDVAAQLAFGTRLKSAEAIAILETTANGGAAPAGKRASAGLGDRMSALRLPNPGAEAGATGKAPSLADRIIAAGKKIGTI